MSLKPQRRNASALLYLALVVVMGLGSFVGFGMIMLDNLNSNNQAMKINNTVEKKLVIEPMISDNNNSSPSEQESGGSIMCRW